MQSIESLADSLEEMLNCKYDQLSSQGENIHLRQKRFDQANPSPATQLPVLIGVGELLGNRRYLLYWRKDEGKQVVFRSNTAHRAF